VGEKSRLFACNQIRSAGTLHYWDSIFSVQMLNLFHPLLVRRWRAVLLLFAAFLSTQGRASAECGDYITIRHTAHAPKHGDLTPEATPITSNDLEHSLPEKVPCHGPNCSRSPGHSLPPIAPVAPAISLAKDLDQGIRPVDEATPQSSRAGDFTSTLPIDRPSPIFHPPRLS
jgi:hypothetical protein